MGKESPEMGGRGRAPTPTALKVLKGNPGRRQLNREEPRIEPGEIPQPTEELDEEGQKLWNQMLPVLGPSGLATRADWATLTALCRLWSKSALVERRILADGPIRVSRKGIPHLHPLWRESTELA